MSFDINGPLNAVIRIIDSITTFPEEMFSGNGMWLIGGLLVVGMAWAGIKVIIESDTHTSALAHATKLVIVAGLATAIIGGGHAWGKQLDAGFNEMAKEVFRVTGAGTGKKGGSTGEMVAEVFSQTISAVATIISGEDEDSLQKQPKGSDAEKMWNLFKSIVVDTPWSAVFTFLISLVFRLVIAIFLLAAALIYCGQLVVTQVMIKIAMIMMPIMVPWMILDSTAFLFNGWLRFTIIAGLSKLVGALIFGITQMPVKEAVKIAAEASSWESFPSTVLAYTTAFLIIGVMAILMLQVTSIASALVSGHGGGSWSPGGKLSPGGMATAGANTIGQGAGKAGVGASRVAGGAVGGANGFIAGSKGFGTGSALKEGMQTAKAGSQLGFGGTVAAALGGAKAGKGSGGGIRDAAAQVIGRQNQAIEKAGNAGQLGSLRQAYRDSRK